MILTDPTGRPATSAIGTRATIDDFFRDAAARRPDAIALVDPPNRSAFTDGACHTLTYAQCDRAIGALARRLRRLGLHTDAIVSLQFANSVESVLTFLAVLRAGLIAMPLPLLWRRADATAALRQVGAHALVVSGRVGGSDHVALACEVAAEIFSLRQVCAFGGHPRDGVVQFDGAVLTPEPDPWPAHEPARADAPGAHLALVTWDVTPAGFAPVARSHAELICGGLAVLLEARLRPDAVVVSTLMLSSFAGLAATLVPCITVVLSEGL